MLDENVWLRVRLQSPKMISWVTAGPERFWRCSLFKAELEAEDDLFILCLHILYALNLAS
jgi:hypothetical protein